jgi:fatty-acyl-CoA synthase
VVLVPVNFMLTADEVAYILRHSGATAMVAEDVLVETAEKALEDGRPAGRAARLDRSRRPGPRRRLGGRRRLAPRRRPADPGVAVADDDPLRLMYTSGTESRPKGVMLEQPLARQPVRQLHRRRRHGTRRRRGALAADVPLRAARLLLLRRRLPRRHQHHPARAPTRRRCWPPSSASGSPSCSAPDGRISLAAPPGFDSADLSSLRKGYYGASPMPVEVLRELQRRLPDVRLWNFYGQTEMAPLATILRPHEQLTTPGSAGRAAINVETMLVDDAGNPCRPGRSARSCTAVHMRHSATTTTRRRRPSVRRRLVPLRRPRVCSEDGYLTSSTARRT